MKMITGNLQIDRGNHIEFPSFEAVIDEPALYKLARKAANSKSGKAKVGPLTVTITSRTTRDKARLW